MTKPVLIAIFAHPDDEAFGPAGTLKLYSKTHDVYVICATRGESGGNNLKKNNGKSLSEIREEELKKSAEILDIKDVIFLEYKDGTLCNNLYHEIASKIMEIIDKLCPEILMTYEPRGVSGHIDHVTISMITSYVFEKSEQAKTLMYYCLDKKERQTIKDYFIYFPPGYSKKEINKIVDTSLVWEIVVKAIRSHASQSKDGESIIKNMKNLPKREYFIIKKRGKV